MVVTRSAAVKEPGQSTFMLLGPAQPSMESLPTFVTSREVKRQHRLRTRGMSRAEQRIFEREQLRRIKEEEEEEEKARQKQRQVARSRAAADRRRQKEIERRAGLRKQGLPLDPPREGQTTLSAFARAHQSTLPAPARSPPPRDASVESSPLSSVFTMSLPASGRAQDAPVTETEGTASRPIVVPDDRCTPSSPHPPAAPVTPPNRNTNRFLGPGMQVDEEDDDDDPFRTPSTRPPPTPAATPPFQPITPSDTPYYAPPSSTFASPVSDRAPIEEPTECHDKGSLEAPVEETVHEPAARSVGETVHEPANEPAEVHTKVPANIQLEEPHDMPIEEPEEVPPTDNTIILGLFTSSARSPLSKLMKHPGFDADIFELSESERTRRADQLLAEYDSRRRRRVGDPRPDAPDNTARAATSAPSSPSISPSRNPGIKSSSYSLTSSQEIALLADADVYIPGLFAPAEPRSSTAERLARQQG